MRLLRRRVVGAGSHRSGWPRVVGALQAIESKGEVLLDDFTESSFCYKALEHPRLAPWVGIFHHPRVIHSPLAGDAINLLKNVTLRPNWTESMSALRGGIALCGDVAAGLRSWMNVPVTVIPHPTERDVPRWTPSSLSRPRIAQVGAFLRNTQLIFQAPVPEGWHRVQLIGAMKWILARDRKLRSLRIRPDVQRTRVEVVRRLDDMAYDRLLAESVVTTELFGAAANNLVVECMVRGTPLIVNRVPAVEEYLGENYPLYFGEVSEIASLLEPDRLVAASRHLLARSELLPSFEDFARRVKAFLDSVN